jgi:hypothetical protein
MPLFALLIIAPIVLSMMICIERNRSPIKGAFITLFFGWFATIGLWLALKTRDARSKRLY